MQVPSSGSVGLVLAMVVTALLFDPVRKWIQERIDQFFYRTRYDYRKTLIEFGRELSSETDLDMSTRGGTQGVGRSTTQAVVVASVMILVTDFFVTKLLITLLGYR